MKLVGLPGGQLCLFGPDLCFLAVFPDRDVVLVFVLLATVHKKPVWHEHIAYCSTLISKADDGG